MARHRLDDELRPVVTGHLNAGLAVIREALAPELDDRYDDDEESKLDAAVDVLLDLVYELTHEPAEEVPDATQRPAN